MKHLRLYLCLLLLPLLLTGCKRPKEEPVPPVAAGFTCGFTGTYRGEAVAGRLERSSAGLLTVSLTEPQELAGLVAEWDGEQVTLRLMGLSWSVDAGTVPQAALGERVLGALDAVVYGTAAGTVGADGRLTITGEAGEGASFTLYADPQTGALSALSVPSEELELTFSDFTTA